MPLDELKVARDEILKRKERDEIIADYREKRQHKSRPYPPYREIERLVKDDLHVEYDEEDYWDVINGDLVEEEEFPSSDSNSGKESDEDSTEDDDDADDDESDNSDD
ncbi:glutamic acid-rich protein-like [Papaver somniferum]|uniref:glutamic acid-rich protein-like n=1 Tax=Papaver somniferum TaxID=3469 RepID=UPI000E6FA9EE|nr:glutamic acid-rich protein-like [Papaver somniferum]